MSAELEATAGTGLTCYFQVRSSTGAIWNGAAFEAYNPANIATYTIAATEQGASGFYTGTMPIAPGSPAGTYNVVMRQKVGGSVAESDPIEGTGTLGWDGLRVVTPANITEVNSLPITGSGTALVPWGPA